MKSQRIQFSLNFSSKHKNHEDSNSRVPHLLGRYSKKKYQHYTLQVAVKLELKSMEMSWGSGGMFLVLLVCGDRQAHSRLCHKSLGTPRCVEQQCDSGTTVCAASSICKEKLQSEKCSCTKISKAHEQYFLPDFVIQCQQRTVGV